jgi:hypothetical protein
MEIIQAHSTFKKTSTLFFSLEKEKELTAARIVPRKLYLACLSKRLCVGWYIKKECLFLGYKTFIERSQKAVPGK